MRLRRRREQGQTMAEFAVAALVILMLIAAIYLAFFYLWRTANVDWGLFAAGAANGSYDGPRGQQVMPGIWEDLRSAFSWGVEGQSVTSQVGYAHWAAGMEGIALMEIHRGQVSFRLWRFYPGPR